MSAATSEAAATGERSHCRHSDDDQSCRDTTGRRPAAHSYCCDHSVGTSAGRNSRWTSGRGSATRSSCCSCRWWYCCQMTGRCATSEFPTAAYSLDCWSPTLYAYSTTSTHNTQRPSLQAATSYRKTSLRIYHKICTHHSDRYFPAESGKCHTYPLTLFSSFQLSALSQVQRIILFILALTQYIHFPSSYLNKQTYGNVHHDASSTRHKRWRLINTLMYTIQSIAITSNILDTAYLRMETNMDSKSTLSSKYFLIQS